MIRCMEHVYVRDPRLLGGIGSVGGGGGNVKNRIAGGGALKNDPQSLVSRRIRSHISKERGYESGEVDKSPDPVPSLFFLDFFTT